MPPLRPRPVHLKPAPRRKKSPSVKREKSKSLAKSSPVPYWIAAILVVVLVALVALCAELPRLHAYFIKRQMEAEEKMTGPLPQEETPKKAINPSSDKTTEDARLNHLQAKVEAETQRLVERPRPQLTPSPELRPPGPETLPPPVVAAPPAIPKALPPLVQPGPVSKEAAPARALPLDPNKLDTERIAAYQVALERMHFSCGFVDGNQGMRTQRMLHAFQTSHGLPSTGFLDQPTRDAIGEPGEPFLNYTVTANDVSSIMPKPAGWREKSQVPRLGYNEMWEMLAEKFHCTRAYLKALNPGVKTPVAGTEMIGPKVFPAAPYPKVNSLRILLGETSIEGLDASGKVIAFFPCSIAADKNKRPNGVLKVKSIVPNPDYTFDPALFADAAAREGLTKKMVLPPGPRNPVGTTWIGLSLPGYGIHGTPEPENISRTQSHGCFRLANWNAEKVLKMVKVGTPVDVQP